MVFPRALGIEPLTKLPVTNASGCHQLAPPPQNSFLVCPGLALTLGTLCWTHVSRVDPEPSPMGGAAGASGIRFQLRRGGSIGWYMHQGHHQGYHLSVGLHSGPRAPHALAPSLRLPEEDLDFIPFIAITSPAGSCGGPAHLSLAVHAELRCKSCSEHFAPSKLFICICPE